MTNRSLRYGSVLLLTLTLILSGCSSAAKKAEDEMQVRRAKLHYQIGWDALNKNQLPKAFEEFMLADKLDPNQPDTLSALAYAWRLRGELERSENYYKRAIRAGADSSAYNNYGSLLLEMKRYKDAKKQLLKALEDPRYRNQFIAYINLGDAYVGLQNLEEALKTYRQAGSFNLKQTLSRIKEAEAYLAFGRVSAAEEVYRELLADNPNNRAIVEGMVNALKRRHAYTAARAQLRDFRDASTSKEDRTWASEELRKLR